MVTLVTGSSGFLGRYLVPHLKKLNPTFSIFSCSLTHPEDHDPNHESIDLNDFSSLQAFIQKIKPQRVFHLAGIAKVSSEISFESYFLQNTLTTQRLLEALTCLKTPIEFFLTSSVHVYGNQTGLISERSELNPISAYGFTKYLAEETLKSFVFQHPQIRGVVGRLYSCIGPKQSLGFVTSDICAKVRALKASRSQNLEVGSLDSFRRFADARDIIKTFPVLLEASNNSRFEVFNIAPSNNVSIREIVQIILKLEQVSPNIISKKLPHNGFKGLNLDTSKMRPFVPDSIFRTLENSIKDILASTPS
jgi:nucleoside-diphosphate-sugar epimerase